MAVITTLQERMKSYSDLTDQKLMKSLPIVIVVNMRSARKISALVQKPFSPLFFELLCATALKLTAEIDGAILGYTYNDEIIIISRNDNSPDIWYDGRVQKISSASSSIATYEFNRLAREKEIELFGDAIFTAQVFALPALGEVVNFLIRKQIQAYHSAVYNACFYNLIEEFDSETVRSTLAGKSDNDKIDLLFERSGVVFSNLPLPFVRGALCYRKPVVLGATDQVKNKLVVNPELPVFSAERKFLEALVRNGKDVFRVNK